MGKTFIHFMITCILLHVFPFLFNRDDIFILIEFGNLVKVCGIQNKFYSFNIQAIIDFRFIYHFNIFFLLNLILMMAVFTIIMKKKNLNYHCVQAHEKELKSRTFQQNCFGAMPCNFFIFSFNLSVQGQHHNILPRWYDHCSINDHFYAHKLTTEQSKCWLKIRCISIIGIFNGTMQLSDCCFMDC